MLSECSHTSKTDESQSCYKTHSQIFQNSKSWKRANINAIINKDNKGGGGELLVQRQRDTSVLLLGAVCVYVRRYIAAY